MPDVGKIIAWALFIAAGCLAVAGVCASPATLDTKLGGTAGILFVASAIVAAVISTGGDWDA